MMNEQATAVTPERNTDNLLAAAQTHLVRAEPYKPSIAQNVGSRLAEAVREERHIHQHRMTKLQDLIVKMWDREVDLQAEVTQLQRPKFPKVVTYRHEGKDHEITIVGEVFVEEDGYAWKSIILRGAMVSGGSAAAGGSHTRLDPAVKAWLDEDYGSERCLHEYDCCAQFYCNGWEDKRVHPCLQKGPGQESDYTTIEVTWSQNV